MKLIHFARTTPFVVALLASSSWVHAQTGSAGGKQAEAPAPAKEQQGVRLTVPVKGLVQDNAAKVETALAAITREFYSCKACHTEQAAKGKCAGCGEEMSLEKKAVFKESKVSVEKSTVSLSADPGVQVALSGLERALKSASVQVDDEKMMLAGKTTLVFKGVASEEEAVALQKVLTDAKLFQSVQAKFDATSKDARVEVDAGPAGPTRPALAKALERASSKAQLSDVLWGGAPAAKARATAAK